MRRLLYPGPGLADFFQQTSNVSSSTATSTPLSSNAEEAASGVAKEIAPLPSPDSSNPQQSTSNSQGTIKTFVSSNPTLKAEICWATKVVTSHYSYKSCEHVGDLFQTMFPDSNIAKQFKCGENKVAYLTLFGIAPHFSSLMKTKAMK